MALGPPRTVAAMLADHRPLRPLWSLGAVAALAVVSTWWTASLVYAAGMVAAVSGAGLTKVTSMFAFVEVTAFSTTTGAGAQWSSELPWLLIPAAITLLAFATGARVWRLLHRTHDANDLH